MKRTKGIQSFFSKKRKESVPVPATVTLSSNEQGQSGQQAAEYEYMNIFEFVIFYGI